MPPRRTRSVSEAPLVSVVLPTHDRHEHLPGAIETVAEQTYDNIELVVVDDGSPEPARQALDDLPTDRLESITFLRHEDNKGANVARNSGIRTASGEYVAFLDDDDRWHMTKVEKQVQAFRTGNTEVGVVYTGTRNEGERGTSTFRPAAEGDVLRDILTGAAFGQFSAVMVDTNAIEAAGLPDERFPAWQDREWFLRLARECHFAPVDEILTYRYIGLPDRITRNFERKRDEAYPLFVEKHYSTAREVGFYYARSFLASLRMDVAWSAVQAERYREARRFFWLAFAANPFQRGVHAHLLPSLGGRPTYESAVKLRRKLTSVRTVLGI